MTAFSKGIRKLKGYKSDEYKKSTAWVVNLCDGNI